jgi:multidrug efflux pump subunit AcrA (membrane-fusion protein)
VTKCLLAISLLAWLAGCGEAPHRTEPTTSNAATPVHTATVAAVELPSTHEATGTVRARTVTTISSKLMGYVREVRVQLGDRVKEAQSLIILDARDLDANLRRAEAARAEIRSTFPEAESGVAEAKATLDLSQVTFNRMQDLHSKRSISNQEFDEASARLKAAQAAYDMARAKRVQLDSRLEQAEQEVRAAQVSHAYTEIAAPFAGVVTGKSVEPGALAIPGAPLLTIEREGTYRLEALVDETRLGAVRIGQTVTVKSDIPARVLSGRVSEIVPDVDAASRAGTVKIDLPSTPELRSGIFARALFGGGTRKAITVPAAAINERGQLQSVLVAENGFAHTRLVTLGAKTGSRVEVLSGLNVGDTVIVPIPQGLADGARVEVVP